MYDGCDDMTADDDAYDGDGDGLDGYTDVNVNLCVVFVKMAMFTKFEMMMKLMSASAMNQKRA